MSRAFVNEDNQEEAPLIPPRAPLPAQATNYVTALGLKLLKSEKEILQKELDDLHTSEDGREKRFKMQFVKGKLGLLEERLSTARLLKVSKDETDEVRFGATVKLRFEEENREQSFQLVGVDEADVKAQKIAFTSPIAKAITGKKAGEQTTLQLGKEQRQITILEIEYATV